jgi:anti-sigma factor RsiW
MSACEDQQSTIMLDVYGELNAEERLRLEQHLEICEGCRKERLQMLEVIGKINTTMESPKLSATEAKRITNSITWKLNHTRSRKWWPQIFTYRPSRVIPAMAAVSILIVIASILGYNAFLADNQFQPTASIQAEQLSAQDFEIIQNLDLLREMEAIQKLVQAVDQKSINPPADNSFNDTQGMKNIIYGEHYA